MEEERKEAMELALKAGQILLENGAEIFRVEETIDRICEHYGAGSARAFTLSNGIFMTGSAGKGGYFAGVCHIPVNKSNMEKVAAVNQLSREIEEGRYSVQEADRRLEEIRLRPGRKKSVQLAAAIVGNAAFCSLFGGAAADCAAAALSGILLYAFLFRVEGMSKIARNILGAVLVTFFCCLLYHAGMGSHPNFMIIGSVMPLVPGVPFTNAIRDIAYGDYISGFVRMLDAVLVFLCIAIGTGVGILLMKQILGGAFL